ncbi:P-loop containing nucleoside triphosphate hydrolase protein [Alternaria rosae]|uniref:P-loop containing nucleoside triphosphate hydrolase protein n=1 Tax=Alternaria rosae TaxID=1187941 RepID=UPI001E8D203C|nr:P-loop containing nucleoside triphosphate hydrolase protein [Alternaria rosae]KAH6865282.1 P-loop containing nucleoside triphosphate hydrolase protein [Alternaria rosae]
MVERALRYDPNQVIQSVRIDGKVQPKSRSLAIKRLHDDPGIRVILITIACGACGLDLTAASAVHLLEPQWNPSLEDQALARVHRLGQTRPVTAIRYVMEDSFEEVLTPCYVWKFELIKASTAHSQSSRSQEAARHNLTIERLISGEHATIAARKEGRLTYLMGRRSIDG